MHEKNLPALMRIQLASLSDGSHAYHFDAVPADLGLPEQFRAPITVEVALEKSGNQIALRTTVRGAGRFVCDRCLGEFPRDLAASYHMVYVRDPAEAERFDPAEVQVLPPAMTVIDLAEDVRQTILLSVPLKLLCAEECRGLCPSCGTNRNTGSCECREEESDPRWEQLRNWTSDSTKH
jgi:uncharacterized protein